VRALILWNPDLIQTGDQPEFELSQFEQMASNRWRLFVDSIARTGWVLEQPELARSLVLESVTQEDWLTRSRAWAHYSVEDMVSEITVPTLVMATSEHGDVFSREGSPGACRLDSESPPSAVRQHWRSFHDHRGDTTRHSANRAVCERVKRRGWKHCWAVAARD
jgi:hypothetical protein